MVLVLGVMGMMGCVVGVGHVVGMGTSKDLSNEEVDFRF